jgi:hypothetical protein
MKKYSVTIPIAGSVIIEVEVDDGADDDAIYEAATAAYNDDESAGEIEWEFVQHITEGNVLNAPVNDWEYEEVT